MLAKGSAEFDGDQKDKEHNHPPPPTATLQNPSPAELSLFSAVIPRGGCRYAFSERCKTYIQQKLPKTTGFAPNGSPRPTELFEHHLYFSRYTATSTTSNIQHRKREVGHAWGDGTPLDPTPLL